MRLGVVSLVNETRDVRVKPYGLLLFGVILAGCHGMTAILPPPAARTTPLAAPPAADSPLDRNDHPMKLVTTPTPNSPSGPASVRLDVVLTVLHVQIPRSEREYARPLWNHLRENVLDAATMLRLHSNGLRVGVGNRQWWAPVQATLDAVGDVRSVALDPVRLPPNYPLALELDTGPHEQTVFFVRDDGTLTGETWPRSRNVLRLSYNLNLEHPERIRLMIVPEIRQRLEGFEWVRTEAGLVQRPNYNGRAVAAAGFWIDLEPGEFLLLAPGERADIFGLVGGTFLAREEDGRRYDSYVFLRTDVEHVARRN